MAAITHGLWKYQSYHSSTHVVLENELVDHVDKNGFQEDANASRNLPTSKALVIASLLRPMPDKEFINIVRPIEDVPKV